MAGTSSARGAALGAICVVAAGACGCFSAIAVGQPRPESRPHPARTSDFGVTIGPFAAKDGYQVKVELIACGPSSGAALVSYERGNRSVAIDHSYIGLYEQCTVNPALTAATVKVRWGSVLNLDLRIAGTSKLRSQSIAGCAGAHLAYRDLTGTGTDTLSIHPAAWGRLAPSKPKVELSAIVGDGCSPDTGSGAIARAKLTPTITVPGVTPTPTSTTTTTTATTSTVTPDGSGSAFSAAFNQRASLFIQSESNAGSTPVTFLTDTARDSPAPGIYGSMDAVIEGPDAFTVTDGDTSAHIGPSASTFITGSLTFNATGGCPPATGAVSGTLSGAITVDDAVFGPLVYNGSSATDAAVGNADADFSACR